MTLTSNASQLRSKTWFELTRNFCELPITVNPTLWVYVLNYLGNVLPHSEAQMFSAQTHTQHPDSLIVFITDRVTGRELRFAFDRISQPSLPGLGDVPHHITISCLSRCCLTKNKQDFGWDRIQLNEQHLPELNWNWLFDLKVPSPTPI